MLLIVNVKFCTVNNVTRSVVVNAAVIRESAVQSVKRPYRETLQSLHHKGALLQHTHTHTLHTHTLHTHLTYINTHIQFSFHTNMHIYSRAVAIMAWLYIVILNPDVISINLNI